MTHEACQERLLDLAYGELGPGEAAEVEAHLHGCEACRAGHARLQGTRAIMRGLEPEPPPAHGEHLVLTAAREAVERHRQRRRLVVPGLLRLSLAAAALVVVGTVSFRVISLRERESPRDIEGRPESFAASAERAAPPGASPGNGPEARAPAPASTAATDQQATPKAKAEVARETKKAAKKSEQAAAQPPVGEGPQARLWSMAPPRATRDQPASREDAAPRLRAQAPLAPGAASRGELTKPTPLAGGASTPPESQKSAPAAPPPVPPSPPASAEPAPPAASSPAAEAPAPPAPAEEAEAAPAPETPPPAPLLSSRTWKRDRRVRAISKLVRDIDAAQRQGRLVESARPFQACGSGEDAERRLYALDGRIVKYVRQVGSPEVALTIEQLYDGEGRLRYVYIHGGAVNGAVLRHRIWLDEDGRRLWEEQRWRRGRYPLPDVWPEKDLTSSAPDASALQCGAP